MKATYTTLKGKLVIDFDFGNTKELVENLAHIQEVCEQEKCTNCGKNDFRYTVRNVDDDKYYELQCKNCYWKLAFSIPKKGAGHLYPRRQNFKTKEWIGPKKDGWHKFDKERDDTFVDEEEENEQPAKRGR